MNISAWAIRNPIAPILAFALLMLLGWQAFRRLPITQFPSIDIPVVSIDVSQPGASPAEMETQVTRIVENAVAGISGVASIQSTVTDGQSGTSVEFRMDVTSDRAVQSVKDAIDGIAGDLPSDVEAPTVTKEDVQGDAILTYVVSAPAMTIEELSWFVDDTVTSALQGRAGVGRIDRTGGAAREIRVELDPARLDAYGVTAAAVNAAIRATNANQGAGRSAVAAGEQAIRLLGDGGSAQRLAATSIALPGGHQVRLSDLGTVADTTAEMRSYARFDGRNVVVFSVFAAVGASEVSVDEQVTAGLDKVRASHPGVSIDLADDLVHATHGNYEAAITTLIEGAVLAVLVVFAFLRNWRATLIAAVALPLSAIPTFFVMDLLGFSLNLISFLAITLATGILVDDAIVEIENIQRHIRMGKTPYRASIDAADEIGLAVVATSFTIVAVFVPVSFMPGVVGQYFIQFGLTVAVAVLFSLLVARLITPLMAAYLMRTEDADHEEHRDGLIMRAYLWFLRVTMQVRYLTLLVAFAILGVSGYFMLQIPGGFLPPEDASRISLSVELPPGATLAATEAVTTRIHEAVHAVDGVRSVFVLGGERGVERATVIIALEPFDCTLERRLLDIVETVPILGSLVPDVPHHGRNGTLRPQPTIEAEILALLAPIPDVRILKLSSGLVGGGERDISYSILSNSEADLNIAVAQLEEALRGEPLLEAVSSEGALPRPELQITPIPDEAARLGVTTAAIAETMRVATIGDFDGALAKVSIDDRLIPVRVQLSALAHSNLDRIGALRIPTATGGSVPLAAVATIAIGEGPSIVNRLSRERMATIGANLPVGVALGTATDRFNEIVATVDLPASVRTAESGDAEIQGELFASFANAMLLALLLMLGVLILLFGSVIQPFTILLSLPLAIGGVAAALIITGSAISMPVLIGILMLMGIVTKNAILLVDFAIEMRAQGLSRVEAIVEAGHKRAQPIIMTSIAMAAGMLPSALGVGEGGSFRAPMAVAVIGGIIVSTVLSLVIVPSFFLIMDDLQRGLGWIFGRFIGARDEEEPAPDPQVLASALATLEGRMLRVEGRDARHLLAAE